MSMKETVMKEIWIVEGVVTDAEMWREMGHPDVKPGDTEWQFSDGKPGERGSSADFLSLSDGLRFYAPAIFQFVPKGETK